ncbi:hypothetical protein NST50_04450 [Paenibacillus sp. FSL E2-0202]|uniref:hypothetical protein n=1 Tax=Paenibacillus TaxID=44249 RepID=UPI00158D6740|nr:hypothetical protein [Paenibacillus odorifer]
MRYYCVEMGGTVKSVRCGAVRCGTVAGCIWLRVYGNSEMDRADLHMVESL